MEGPRIIFHIQAYVLMRIKTVLRLFNLTCKPYGRFSIAKITFPVEIVAVSHRGFAMKIFTQKFNPLSGQHEWVMQDEDYDYYQEVARSAYADMLHDEERNQKYFEAIRKAVKSIKKEGKLAKVLDIGTGTGLLSMMAVRSGADSVIACEAFKPVAECALKVIKENGLESQIKIIPKRSTELSVGPDGDLPEKANILVTEVFDTELIGEGALYTFRHALNNLLEPDSIVVPSSATVYAQVVESDVVSRFNKLYPIVATDHILLEPPINVTKCRGAAAVHDVQMAQLPEKNVKFISKPKQVFRFNFYKESSIIFDEKTVENFEVCENGVCEAVFMWWELEMDTMSEIILSCAPPWAHPNPENMPWRDHWMQAIYYLPKRIEASAKETMYLHSYHDEFSLWFDVTNYSPDNSLHIEAPVCSCLMHCTMSRSRIGMLNDDVRNRKYGQILQKYITPSTVCLCISSGSLLPLIACSMGAKLVYALEPSSQHCELLKSYSSHNSIDQKLTVINKPFEDVKSSDLQNVKVDVILAEPYFTTSLVPWDALYFWYLRDSMSLLLQNNAVSIPQRATIKCLAVEFEDLWKIRAPIVNTQGFTLSAFDRMIQEAIAISDSLVEPHPLWEYKNKPLTGSCDLLTFDLSSFIPTKVMESSGKLEFLSKGCCNGVAIWADFETDGVIISTGPTEPVHPSENISWDMYTRQGVYFIQPCTMVNTNSHNLLYKVKFNPKTGSLDFSFSVNENK